MTTQVLKKARRRDRWVSWFVLGIFVIALILGWVVKTAAEGRTVTYEVEGVRVEYPQGWQRASVQSPYLLVARDQLATPSATTLMLQRRALPENVTNPIQSVHQNLTLERGRNWQAYRVLDVEQDAAFYGRTGQHVTFAYVEANPNNPFLEQVPVVMYGEDYIFASGDQVYIATLTAAEENYDRAQKDLRAFMRALQE